MPGSRGRGFRGRLQRALALADALARLEPEGKPRMAIGATYQRAQRWAEACEQYQKLWASFQTQPCPPEVRAELANSWAWCALNESDAPLDNELLAIVLEALAAQPDSAALQHTCGEALVRAGRLQEGQALLLGDASQASVASTCPTGRPATGSPQG